MGRFFNVDPLSEKYSYQSHYNFSENRVVDGRELEGLEWIGIATRFMPMMENTGIRPVIEPLSKPEVIEGTAKASRFSKEQLEHFNLGRKVEKEVLDKMGLEKNTETFEFKDPKTGKLERTIPDAMTKDGGTVEVKHVQKQSLTKQLRGQIEISKQNGAEALLKLNEKATTTKPLERSGIRIERYQPSIPKTDNIKANSNPPAFIRSQPVRKDACAKIPNCI